MEREKQNDVKCATGFLLLMLFATAWPLQAANLNYLEQLPIETFAKIREVERYQLKIAEKYYLQGEYKVAINEYEKFLSIYERSAAAPYAQLMWSHCQFKLRKTNTAIKDGFQSVIDYWPESHEAILSAYLIGNAYKSMGELSRADKAFQKTLAEYPKHHVAVLAQFDQLDIAKIKDDQERRVELMKELTFNTPRTKATEYYTSQAAKGLASILFYKGDFDEGLKALETQYSEHHLEEHIHGYTGPAISHLTGNSDTRELGHKLADKVVGFLNARVPVDLSEDKNKARARWLMFRIASVHGSARRPKEVLETYERMAKLFGADDEILGHIAGWYKGQNRRDDAKKVYGRFADQINGQKNVAYMFREEKNYDRAIEIYRKLMGDDPEHANWHLWQIAECYEGGAKFKEAIGSYRQCDNYPAAYFRMASCHRHLKQYREALVLYNQAKSHDGSAPEAQLQIAFTYEQSGEKEKAIRSFQQTCKAYPKSGHASRAHAHLQDKYKISVTLGGAKDE